jgi:MFS family permease
VEPARRYTPPALFLLLDLPYGGAVGYGTVAVPFWLAARGVPLETIAALSATAFTPFWAKIFWIPLLDVGSRRKLWYLASSGAVAAGLAGLSLFREPARDLAAFTALLTATMVAATTGHAALNALVAVTVRDDQKGRAAGFYMASNVGSTGLLGALALWLADHSSPAVGGLVLAAIVSGAGTLALLVREPRLADPVMAAAGSLARAAGLRLTAMARDLWATLRSREGFTGLLLCLAPVGCGALTNLFSGLAHHYRAPADLVELVNGVGSGAVGALGSLLGGALADRMSRRLAYALSGAITALAALAMLASPLTRATYAWGTLLYGLANGVAFAAWAGMVLEMVGHTAAVATKYALFNAALNVSINYVTFLDGALPARLGWSEARGALLADALLTFAGVAFVGGLALAARRPGRAVAAASASGS